jgi:hypothetical protein
MRPSTARGLLAATFAATAAIAACSYSPSFESGTLLCGPGASCPENYHCMANYCYRDGEVTGTAGSGGGSGGRGGAGGTGGGDPKAKFIGRWNFVAPAQRVRVCPGVNETVPLPVDADDFITIGAGSGGVALSAFYYCDWNLDLNAAGTATVIRAGQSCSDVDTSIPPYTFTWTGQSFTLTTSDGRSGTIEASIPYSYTSTAATGSCSATFTGPVMKN